MEISQRGTGPAHNVTSIKTLRKGEYITEIIQNTSFGPPGLVRMH